MDQQKNSYINIYEEVAKHPLPSIDRPRSSDGDFIADVVEVGNLFNKFLAISAALVPVLSLDKLQQGVLLGHMVRMHKLYDGFLLLISEKHTEMALLAARALTETSITLKYLVHHINDEKLYGMKHFEKYTMRYLN